MYFVGADLGARVLPRVVLWLLLCYWFMECQFVAQAASISSFGTKIEAGTRECYTEILEAGGTLAFTFRVTDGDSLDIDAFISLSHTPPVSTLEALNRMHFNQFFMGLRDRVRTDVVNTWQHASDGSQTVTAPSALVTKHGLPSEITVCFDNRFSAVSPKWVHFALLKHDVLQIDQDAVTRVETEMEERLHRYGTIMFGLAQDVEKLRLTSESDRVKSATTAKLLITGVVFNVLILITMVSYQFYLLTRFLQRQCSGNYSNVVSVSLQHSIMQQ